MSRFGVGIGDGDGLDDTEDGGFCRDWERGFRKFFLLSRSSRSPPLRVGDVDSPAANDLLCIRYGRGSDAFCSFPEGGVLITVSAVRLSVKFEQEDSERRDPLLFLRKDPKLRSSVSFRGVVGEPLLRPKTPPIGALFGLSGQESARLSIFEIEVSASSAKVLPSHFRDFRLKRSRGLEVSFTGVSGVAGFDALEI